MALLSVPKLNAPAVEQDSKVAQHVKVYSSLGLHSHPIIPNEKRPAVPGWPDAKNGPYQFNENNNVGLLTGVMTEGDLPFAGIDLDLSGNDPVTKALRDAIVKEFENQFGSTVIVESGGNHYGNHLWLRLTEAITKKIQLKLNLHHTESNIQSGIEVMCQGSQGGFNLVAPPSTVEREYRFLGDVTLENLGEHILKVETSQLLEFLESKVLKILFGLGELCSLLFKLYQDRTVDGELLDYALAHFVIEVLKLQDDGLWYLAFQMCFGEHFDLSRTSYILERTIERLEAGFEVAGMGSVVDKLDDDLKKKLLQAMEQLEIVCGVKKEPAALTNNAQPVKEVTEQSKDANKLVSNSSIFALQEEQTVPDEWLIHSIVPLGRFILLHGPAGIGKTTSACHIADRAIAATGKPVIYINLELKQGDIEEKKQNLSVSQDLLKVAYPKENFLLFNEDHQKEMSAFFEDLIEQGTEPCMIIVDSLMAATQGELNQGAVGGAMIFFNKLAAKLNCTVLLIHHNNKDENNKGQSKIFGSALIAGAVVMSWEIDKMEECALTRKITVSKSNLRDLSVGDEIIVGQLPGREPILKRLENGHELDRSSMKLVDKCVNTILDELGDGKAKLAEEIRKVLIDVHGFSESTISRASKILGVKKYIREGVRYWILLKDSIIFDLCQAPAIKQ